MSKAIKRIGLQFFARHQPRYYSLMQNADNGEADIVIYGDITSWRYQESDVSSYTLSRQIAGLDVDTINVYINSYGGETAEGLAIYNELRRHKAKIRTVSDGFACSAASIVFMAGDERLMNPASLLMIHNAWSSASGNAEELRKAADDLETISTTAAAVYREAVNIPDGQLDQLLAAESWITPEQAVAWGFATGIAGPGAANKPQQCARQLVYDRLTKTPEPEAPAEKTVATFLCALGAKGE